MTQPSELPAFESAHFIGIGGAGMSGIALVLHERGCTVTGSDLKSSRYVRELENAGIEVTIGHAAPTIDACNPDVVVISSAIPETNPELIRARELGIEVWPRAKMLAALSRGSTIAVAGTHGKTTTSAMVATMLDVMGLDPSFLVGGIVEGYDTNGRNGQGDYFVCEADESDGSFLFLNPSVAVVTNIEADHLDHYGSLEQIERTFCTFMSYVGDEGCVVVCGDDAHVVELARSTGRRVVTYGFTEGCDVRCVRAERGEGISSIIEVEAGDRHVNVQIKHNPGRHNMLNATCAIAVAQVLGLDVEAAAGALSEFKGARRRFTLVDEVSGITVVDDYGHHPTEVKSTLEAARGLGFERVVVLFQPHRYSRTEALAEEFGTAFDAADVLRVMDVFGAGEMPIPGVSGKTISDAVKRLGAVDDVAFVKSRRSVLGQLKQILCPGDLLITMGAGDITTVGPDLVALLEEDAS